MNSWLVRTGLYGSSVLVWGLTLPDGVGMLLYAVRP